MPNPTTDRQASALDALSALGQSTRLRIFRHLVALAPEPQPAGGIADALGCLQNTLSTHLAILVRAGLITGVRDGRSRKKSKRTPRAPRRLVSGRVASPESHEIFMRAFPEGHHLE